LPPTGDVAQIPATLRLPADLPADLEPALLRHGSNLQERENIHHKGVSTSHCDGWEGGDGTYRSLPGQLSVAPRFCWPGGSPVCRTTLPAVAFRAYRSLAGLPRGSPAAGARNWLVGASGRTGRWPSAGPGLPCGPGRCCTAVRPGRWAKAGP